MAVAVDLHFVNHQGARFQLNIVFTVLLKKKLDHGLRVSKLETRFHLLMNDLFKTTSNFLVNLSGFLKPTSEFIMIMY